MRAPDMRGPRGEAWKAEFSAEVRAKWPAGCDTWLVHLPGQHPAWSWYVLTSCALRAVEGTPPAILRSPDMTHEINVIALDPNFVATDEWASDSEHRWGKFWLTPLNMSEQLGDFTDEQINELAFVFVRAFLHGQASPEQLRSVLGALAQGTADHIRRGLHTPS